MSYPIRITVPVEAMRMALDETAQGDWIECSVAVNCPAWTEAQALSNAVSLMAGESLPHPDKQLITLLLPRMGGRL